MARKPERNHRNQSIYTSLFLSKRPNGLNRLKNSTWAYHILRISLIGFKQKAMMSSTFQVRESPYFIHEIKKKGAHFYEITVQKGLNPSLLYFWF